MSIAEDGGAAPLASAAAYDEAGEKILLTLRNGVEVSIPARLIQGVSDGSREQRAALEVAANGRAIHWDDLDIHLSVEGLLQGAYGARSWMQDLTHEKSGTLIVDVAVAGRKGGLVKSEAKARASAANGAKGGRPRKTVVA